MNAFKSKTIWFSIILALGGVAEQYASVITNLVGPKNGGMLMIGISVIVAVLRVYTTQSLNDK